MIDRAAILARYIDGERPAQIAAALGLELAAVEAALPGGTPAPADAPEALPAPKPRKRRAPAAPADATAQADASAQFDPGDAFAERNAVSRVTRHGYGFATVSTGRRRVY